MKTRALLKHTLTILLLLLPTMVSAIVNMNGLHFEKNSKPFNIDISLRLSGSSGNSNTKKESISGQFSWVYDKSIHLAILGFDQGESNNVRDTDKAFTHYRFINKINDTLDWELFAQLEQNEFTRLTYRGFIGAGVRVSVLPSKNHHTYFGSGAFHVKEKIAYVEGLTDDGVESFARANIYLLSQYNVSSTVKLSNAVYYQPRLSDIADYRALAESKLDIKINDEMAFRVSLEIEHDNKPSQTIEKTDVNYMTGLMYSF